MKNPQKQYTTTLQNDIGKKDKQKKEKKKQKTPTKILRACLAKVVANSGWFW